MAAFSFQHYPFHFDSVMSAFLEHGEMNDSMHYPYDSLPDIIAISAATHEDYVDYIDDGSVTEKQQTDSVSSSLAAIDPDQQHCPMDKKRKNRDGSCLQSAESKDAKEGNGRKQKKYNRSLKATEKKLETNKKKQKKVSEEPPTGYIHVRARRGQATDSHSLAERERRFRISERMKLLQGLVPGCDKVTGKALMLDEIINYVQSLQNQVEFLSMKLASICPVLYDFSADLDDCVCKTEKMSIPTALPCMRQCNNNQFTAISDSTKATFLTTNNYHLLDSSSAVLLQGVRPDAFSKDNTDLVRAVEDQRDSFINQAVHSTQCSFQ